MKAKILIEHEIDIYDKDSTLCGSACEYLERYNTFCQLFEKELEYNVNKSWINRCEECLKYSIKKE